MLFDKAYLASVPFDNTYRSVYDFINLSQNTGNMVSGSLLSYLQAIPESEHRLGTVYTGAEKGYNLDNGKTSIIIPMGFGVEMDRYNYMILTYGTKGTAKYYEYYYFITGLETLSNDSTQYSMLVSYKCELELDVWTTYYERIRGYNGTEHVLKQTFDQWAYNPQSSIISSKEYYTNENEVEVSTIFSDTVDMKVLWLKATLNNAPDIGYRFSTDDANQRPIQRGVGVSTKLLPIIYIPVLYCDITQPLSEPEYIWQLQGPDNHIEAVSYSQLPSLLKEGFVRAEFTYYTPFDYTVTNTTNGYRVKVLDSHFKCGFIFQYVTGQYEYIAYSYAPLFEDYDALYPIYCVVDTDQSIGFGSSTITKTIPKTGKSGYSFDTKNNLRNAVGVMLDDARMQYYPFRYSSVFMNNTFTPIKDYVRNVDISITTNGAKPIVSFKVWTSDEIYRKAYSQYSNNSGEYMCAQSAESIYNQSKGLSNTSKMFFAGIKALANIFNPKALLKGGINFAETGAEIEIEQEQLKLMPNSVSATSDLATEDILYQDRVAIGYSEPILTEKYKRVAKQIKDYGINYNSDDRINKAYHIIFDYKKLDKPRVEIPSIPDFARKKLKEMFNNGVRLWHIDMTQISASGNTNYKNVIMNMDLEAGNPSIVQYYYGGTGA